MDEGSRGAQSDRARHVASRFASALLLLMFLVWLLALAMREGHPGWSWLAAFSEAALVGGLADWFAVTALFRHPLGLPIPHTAILPSNRQRLADSLADFLEHNFLTAEVLAREFAQADFAALAGRWLSSPAHRRWLVRRALQQGGDFLRGGSVLAAWVAGAVEQQRHQQLFDYLLVRASGFVDAHQAVIYRKVSEKSPRWMPRRFNDEFFVRLVEGVQELLEEMRAPGSDARAEFTALLEQLAAQLDSGRVEELLAPLPSPALGGGRRIPRQLEFALEGLGERLLADEGWRDGINRRLREQAVQALLRQRHQIVGLVRRVVLSWDLQTLAGRTERLVGRDLQFIRINGTVVGGLAGLLLHGLGLMTG